MHPVRIDVTSQPRGSRGWTGRTGTGTEAAARAKIQVPEKATASKSMPHVACHMPQVQALSGVSYTAYLEISLSLLVL